MAQYDRIKRKGSGLELGLPVEQEDFIDILNTHWMKLAAILGIVVILGATIYGGFYYVNLRHDSAQDRFFRAINETPVTGASKAQGETGIAALTSMIEQGGPPEVIAQAYLELAALHWRSNDIKAALDSYRTAIDTAPKDGLLSEIARAGEAAALTRDGKYEKAAAAWSALNKSAKFYPKSTALYSTAIAQAMAGLKDEAIGTLNQLKGDHPGFIPDETINDLTRRIDANEITTWATLPQPVAPSEEVIDSERKIGVHN